jgi:hypothetical protein
VRRESHTRFCESLGLRFPGATHPTAMNVSQREGLGADGIMANYKPKLDLLPNC